MLKQILNILRSILINPYKGFLSKGEFKRIKNLDRFTKGSTIFLGRKIEFSDNYGFLCSIREIFIEKQSYFKSFKKQPIIIDCGANIGLTIIYFKTIYPEAKIIAFEPDDNVFEILERNISIFEYKDVTLYKVAVWNENKNLVFYSQGSLSGSLESSLSKGKNAIQVKGLRLKEYLTDDEIDFINMDIEGAESTVIPDIKEKLNNVQSIFIEYHSISNQNQKLSDLIRIVEEAGFKYYIRNIENEINFIVKNSMESEFDLVLCIYCYRI